MSADRFYLSLPDRMAASPRTHEGTPMATNPTTPLQVTHHYTGVVIRINGISYRVDSHQARRHIVEQFAVGAGRLRAHAIDDMVAIDAQHDRQFADFVYGPERVAAVLAPQQTISPQPPESITMANGIPSIFDPLKPSGSENLRDRSGMLEHVHSASDPGSTHGAAEVVAPQTDTHGQMVRNNLLVQRLQEVASKLHGRLEPLMRAQAASTGSERSVLPTPEARSPMAKSLCGTGNDLQRLLEEVEIMLDHLDI